MKLSFREWSILAEMGPDGSAILDAMRDVARARRRIGRRVLFDALRCGTGVMSMGEGCTPIRIPPERFFRTPDERQTDGES